MNHIFCCQGTVHIYKKQNLKQVYIISNIIFYVDWNIFIITFYDHAKGKSISFLLKYLSVKRRERILLQKYASVTKPKYIYF